MNGVYTSSPRACQYNYNIVSMKDKYNIRPMTEADRSEVLRMMRDFYSSDAVMTDGSEEIFNSDIDECVSDSPFARGFVFETSGGENFETLPGSADAHYVESSTDRADRTATGSIQGYAMIALSYSTEFGRRCVWIEDIYLEEGLRGSGAATDFFDLIREEYPEAVHRLEAEHENEHAVRVYRHLGFEEIPYLELIRR